MKYYIVICLIIGLCTCVEAQTDTIINPSDSNRVDIIRQGNKSGGRFDNSRLLYRKEFLGGIHIHTNGWGFNGRIINNQNLLKKSFWDYELSIMKHPKEYKLQPFNEDAKKYVFGKKNALAILRVSYGKQKILYSKETKKGVQVSSIYSIGAALGIVKPVYLEITYPNGTGNETERFEKYNEEIHSQGQINGRAPILMGIDEIFLIPGAHIKGALNFEYSNEDNMIRAIEAGLTFDALYKEIPIMAFTKNHRLFLNLFISFQLGKKTI